jgi:Fic family protein
MNYQKDKPFNELKELPPLNELVETSDILKKTNKANKALAFLRGSVQRLPNPTILISSIALQEAKFSSEIENILTTNDELYQASSYLDAPQTGNTKEVLSYQEALFHGWTILKTQPVLSTNLFIELVQIIKKNNSGIRQTTGTKIKNGLGQTVYTPPEGESIIRNKLSNLERFMNLPDDELDPLIKMAITHYQFEAIHPFGDGNGRTGRIINILYLVANNLLDYPILYLSQYIIENKSEYYSLIRRVTEKEDWETWILYILEAVEKTSKATQDKVDRICQCMKDISHEIQDKAPELFNKKGLLEVLFERPYCKVQYLVEKNIAKEQTARAYLKKLEEIGVLASQQVWKEKLYLNHSFYSILQDNPTLKVDEKLEARIQSFSNS